MLLDGMHYKPLEHVPVQNTLGEGVLWDDRLDSVWWTDIPSKTLWRYCLATKELLSFETPERLCSFGLTNQAGLLICAFETGFALFEPLSNTTSWINRPLLGKQGVRFNDGRVDNQGRFWSGMMIEAGFDPPPKGAEVWCIDSSHSTSCHEHGLTISNAMCWSPDSSKFYLADSPDQTIWTYDFDQHAGTISNRKVFVQTEPGVFPDGAVTDAQGRLWNAQWGGSQLVCYQLDGSVDFVIKVPVSQPTCVAFGGKDLNLLFVTTAREGLSQHQLEQEPCAGDLLIYKLDTNGLPSSRFEVGGV